MFDQKKHGTVMHDLIVAIYRSPAGSYLGFKGGTMAYYFFGLDRFSVDLDFDLLNLEKKDYVFKILTPIISKYGSLKEAKEKYYTLFFLLNYEKGAKNIKIEISKRKNGINRYKIVNFYGTDVKILNEMDSFTHKLLAATTRKRLANRDFFDVFFYLKKGYAINERIIKEVTGKDTKTYLKYLINFTEKNLINDTILHGLGELINAKQKFWIKNRLKEELLNRLKYSYDQIR